MKKALGLIIKSLFSIILLYLILQKLGIKQLVSKLSEGKLEFLLLGIILGLICNLIKLFKWSCIVDNIIKCSFWDALRSYTIGNSIGLITPLRAGELGRALYFNKEYYAHIAGMTIFDRALDVTSVLILSVPGAFLLMGTKFGILLTSFALAITAGIFKSGFIMRLF